MRTPNSQLGQGLCGRLQALWTREHVFRRQLADIGFLLSGNFLSAFLGLVAFMLTARALGPAGYGMLALLHAYARAIERFVSFQSWQPLIKYGADAQSGDRREDFAALMKFGLILDIVAAAAAWLIALAGAWLFSKWSGWSGETLSLICLYTTILLFTIVGMPTAVLRLFGNFRILAIVQVTSASLRLLLCAIGLWIGAGVLFFVLVWMALHILTNLSILALALVELKRQNFLGLLLKAPGGITKKYPDLWNFTWTANLSLTLRASVNELDVLLVGLLTDVSSAGLYQIAKRAGRLAQQVGAQVQAVLYPDIAKLWAKRAVDAFKRSVFRIECLLTAFGIAAFIIFLFLSEPLLRWTAGPAFAPAADLLIVQMAAVAVNLMGIALRSALLSMGAQRQILHVALMGTVAFFATMFLLTPHIGAMGANVGHLVLGSLNLVAMILLFKSQIRQAAEGRRR